MNSLRLIISLLLAMAIATVRAALAAPKREIEVPWDELQDFTGRVISLTLPDAARIEGTLDSVDRDSLRIRVDRSTNLVRHPRGEMRIAREVISQFEYHSETTRRLPWGELAGGVIGATGGALAGGFIGKGVGTILGGPLGGGIGTLFGALGGTGMGMRVGSDVGGSRDHKRETTIVHIIPDRPRPVESPEPSPASLQAAAPALVEPAGIDAERTQITADQPKPRRRLRERDGIIVAE